MLIEIVYRIWKYHLQNGGHFVAPQYIKLITSDWLTRD